MSDSKPKEIIIHGTTSNGKIFRPSDWAERLCGILSSFNKDHRLSYHEWVHPILIEKVRCVAIDAKLEEINPSMFRFLMDFAADNDLCVLNSNTLPEAESCIIHTPDPISTAAAHTASIEQPAAPPAQPSEPETRTPAPNDTAVLREIAPTDTATAFAALSVLRPNLNDINGFTAQVNKTQRIEGYRMLGIYEEGKANAVAVLGFRERTNLVSGRHLHIDDLVTMPQCRKRGYAGKLLSELEKIAQAAGISVIQVDSNVSGERATAHRVYFQYGYEISAYHFVRRIDGQ